MGTVLLTDYHVIEGINKLEAPVRIDAIEPDNINPQDPRKVHHSLIEGTNIDLDSTGMIHRRGGRVIVKSGKPYSIKAWNDICLFGEGVYLKRLAEDLSTTSTLFTGIIGGRISYSRFEDDIYFSDANTLGVIGNGLYSTLPSITYGIRREVIINHLNTTRMPTPPGQLICHHGGRLYSAVGNELWASDPFAFHRTHKTKGLVMQASGYITLLYPVTDGLFVSDGDGIWYLNGMSSTTFNPDRKDDALAILDAVTTVDVHSLDKRILEGKYFMFLTNKGVCLAGDKGFFKNITSDKYPDITAKRGAALFRFLKRVVSGQEIIIPQLIVTSEN